MRYISPPPHYDIRRTHRRSSSPGSETDGSVILDEWAEVWYTPDNDGYDFSDSEIPDFLVPGDRYNREQKTRGGLTGAFRGLLNKVWDNEEELERKGYEKENDGLAYCTYHDEVWEPSDSEEEYRRGRERGRRMETDRTLVAPPEGMRRRNEERRRRDDVVEIRQVTWENGKREDERSRRKRDKSTNRRKEGEGRDRVWPFRSKSKKGKEKSRTREVVYIDNTDDELRQRFEAARSYRENSVLDKQRQWQTRINRWVEEPEPLQSRASTRTLEPRALEWDDYARPDHYSVEDPDASERSIRSGRLSNSVFLTPSSSRSMSTRRRERSRSRRRTEKSRTRTSTWRETFTTETHHRKVKEKKSKITVVERPVLGFVLETKPRFVKCVTCMEDDIVEDEAVKLDCDHHFCHSCLRALFTLSLTSPAHMPPRCCTPQHIPLHLVAPLLPYKLKKQWNAKYREFSTPADQRLYCAAPSCALWIPPENITASLGTCEACGAHTCQMCSAPAHADTDCPNDADTARVLQLAKEQGMQRCLGCRAIVELERGCNHITCTCGTEFCYRCGARWKSCPCPWFNWAPPSPAGSGSPHRRLRQLREDEALARRIAREMNTDELAETVAWSGEEDDEDEAGFVLPGPMFPVGILGTLGLGFRDGVRRWAARGVEGVIGEPVVGEEDGEGGVLRERAGWENEMREREREEAEDGGSEM